jgi:hypothetical protein
MTDQCEQRMKSKFVFGSGRNRGVQLAQQQYYQSDAYLTSVYFNKYHADIIRGQNLSTERIL